MIVGKMFFLMLDLLVALFDTLDHTILVFNYFGFSHTVLTSRTHSVIIATQHLAIGG